MLLRIIPTIKQPLSLLFIAILIGIPSTVWAIPKNIAELFTNGDVFLSGILLLSFAAIILGTPRLIVASLERARHSYLFSTLTLLVSLCFSWLMLRDAVPAESIHDILGSPVNNWLWEWEYIYRFSALFSWLILNFTVSVLLANRLLYKTSYTHTALWQFALLFIIGFIYFHLVSVENAASDNLTELMENNGTILSSIY